MAGRASAFGLAWKVTVMRPLSIRVAAKCMLLACSISLHSGTVSAGANSTQAIELVAQGEFAAAREVLRMTVAGRSDAPLHLAQLEGIILRKQGRNREAVDVFRFILSREPNFTPARIELSRALAEIGDRDAALHQLQVIELGSNDPEVRRQARTYGDAVKSQRPYGFSGYVSFLPSTNVNRGSRQKVFKVGDMDFVIDDDSRKQSGIGVATGANAYRTFYLDATTTINVSGAFDVKKYSGTSDFDELSLSTNLSLAKRFGRMEFSVGPTMDYRLLAWEPYAFRYGIAFGSSLDIATHTRLYAGGTFLKQSFQTYAYRNGWTFLGYTGVRHAFSPSLAASLTLTHTTERTQRDYLNHKDNRLLGQIDREWSGGLITSIAAGIGYHDYQGNYPGTSISRRDTVWSAGITAANRNWSYAGFAPQLKYEYSRQHSNISFYDYDSHDVDLTFTKMF